MEEEGEEGEGKDDVDLVLRTKEDMAVASWDWRVEFSAEKRAVMILSTLQTQGTLCQEENKVEDGVNQ